MQITARNLQDNLITEFSYHDATIIKVEKNNTDVTILFKDGFNEGQFNELKFINCKIVNKNDLKNRTIYQLDDLVNFGRTKWYMSFLVWVDGGLLEQVRTESDNIIAKKYEIKENLLSNIYNFSEKQAILSDFNNYTLVREEDLNKETYDKD